MSGTDVALSGTAVRRRSASAVKLLQHARYWHSTVRGSYSMSSTEVAYGGTEVAYGVTEVAYGGAEVAYADAEVAYADAEVAYGGTEVAYGGSRTRWRALASPMSGCSP
eukprot:2515170-Rhodomonas_salina.1